MYQNKAQNALKVLQKYFPEIPKDECERLFKSSCDAYNEAVLLVKENELHYKGERLSIPEAEKIYRKKYSMLPDQFLSSLIGWVYHWYFER